VLRNDPLLIERFGDTERGFALDGPLSEPDLLRFEIAHKVRLPDDYRGFLLRVENGPLGTYFELERLDLSRSYPELLVKFPWNSEVAHRLVS
jgi:hypothetical protein